MSGCAVGAVLAPKRHVQTVIKALDERQWRKKRVRVASVHDDEGLLAVAVAPEGARALDAHCSKMEAGPAPSPDSGQVPSLLAELLADGAVRWATGHRAGAAAAAPGPVREVSGSVLARFTYAELFAGIGGFRLALDALGGKCVFASEIEPCAAATYARNFGEQPAGDITEVNTEVVPEHDLLTAGFPCQSFSRTGEQLGLSDSRGDLFFEIVRVATKGRPRALLLENVPNLLRIGNGHTLHIILSALSEAGYHSRVQLINAAALVPQHRERLYIVAFRADQHAAAAAFSWPLLPATRLTRVRDILEKLSPEESARYQLSSSQWAQVRASSEYRHNPQWRLAQLDGAARTLRGSYRRSYARFSECVPGEMYNTIQSFSRPLRRSRLGSRATRCSLVGTVRNIKGKQRKVQKEAALQQERCSRVVSRRCK